MDEENREKKMQLASQNNGKKIRKKNTGKKTAFKKKNETVKWYEPAGEKNAMEMGNKTTVCTEFMTRRACVMKGIMNREIRKVHNRVKEY